MSRERTPWAAEHERLSKSERDASALETKLYNELRGPAEALEKAIAGIGFWNARFNSTLHAEKNEFLEDVEKLLQRAKDGPKKTALQKKYDAYKKADAAFDAAHKARQDHQGKQPPESADSADAKQRHADRKDLEFVDDDEDYEEAKRKEPQQGKAPTQAVQNDQPEEKFEDDAEEKALFEEAKTEVDGPAIKTAVEAYINMHQTAVWATVKINDILRANGRGEQEFTSLYSLVQNEKGEYEEVLNVKLLREFITSHTEGYQGRQNKWVPPISNEAARNELTAINAQLSASMAAYEAAEIAAMKVATITPDEKVAPEDREWGGDEENYLEAQATQKESDQKQRQEAVKERLNEVKEAQKQIYETNYRPVYELEDLKSMMPQVKEFEKKLAEALPPAEIKEEKAEAEPLLEDTSLPAQKTPFWKRAASAAMVIADLAAVIISIAMVLDLILLSSLPILPIALVTGVLGIVAIGAPIANAILARNMSSDQKVRRGVGLLALGLGMVGGLIALAVILTITKATITLTGPFLIGVIVAASVAALLSISVGGWLIRKRHSAEEGKGLAADAGLGADMVQALFMPAAPAPKGSGPSCSTGGLLHPHKLGQPGVSPEPDKPTAQPVSTRGAPRGGMVQKVNQERYPSHPTKMANKAAAAGSKPAPVEAPRGRYT